MMRRAYNILIADDDPTVHKLIGAALKDKGYLIESAMDGPEALNSIQKKRPDLLILDLMMPRISGIDICRQIKENPLTKSVKVMILSAKDSQEDRLEGLQLGADDYITKPFHIASLMRKIENMVGVA